MTRTQPVTWTINIIKNAVRAAGSHWFDPDTMRFFGTSVLPTVWKGPGGIYFVTRDRGGPGEGAGSGYTVRRFDPGRMDIETVGSVGALSKRKAALAARNLARAAGELSEVQQTSEKFQPVSVLDQFTADLRKHGNPQTSAETARKLIKAAYRHHYYAEEACNSPEGAEFAERNRPSVRKQIRQLAEAVGATGVVFSGDPRGATVKLTFADGTTNDWGREGYCVPTNLKGD